MKLIKTLFGVLVMNISINLAQAQYTPTVFTPVEYKPVETNYGGLEKSFKRREERSNLAYQKYSELAQLIGEKRMKISNDRETSEWFSKNIDGKLKEVKNSLDIGDYGGAIECAIRAIGEIHSNSELIGRIQTYEEYKKILKDIQSRTDLTYSEKQEWINKYQYKFVPMYNSNGEVIGAYKWIDVGGPNNTRVVIPSYNSKGIN